MDAEQAALAEILRAWDFMGVYEDEDTAPADDEEYDDLVIPLTRWLREGLGPESLQDHLASHVGVHYGASVSDWEPGFFSALYDWWRTADRNREPIPQLFRDGRTRGGIVTRTDAAGQHVMLVQLDHGFWEAAYAHPGHIYDDSADDVVFGSPAQLIRQLAEQDILWVPASDTRSFLQRSFPDANPDVIFRFDPPTD